MCGITLTGADEKTPINDLVELARLGAEIGILYTFSPDGRNRYPSRGWIALAVSMLGKNAAIHICGDRARQRLYDGDLGDLIDDVGRIQVNGILEPQWVARICERYPTKTIITQHTSRNIRLLQVTAPNHAVLVDASGGRGELPVEWSRPATDKPVGFAGGLGRKNLREQLPIIAAVTTGHPNGWWIDMESSLRNEEDWFDVGEAMLVMQEFAEWKEKESIPCG